MLTALHIESHKTLARGPNNGEIHHVMSDDAERIASQYSTTCAKVGDTLQLGRSEYKSLPMINGSVAAAIVEASHDADVLIMGTSELADVKKRHMLGSIALHIAKHTGAPLCVVKFFG